MSTSRINKSLLDLQDGEIQEAAPILEADKDQIPPEHDIENPPADDKGHGTKDHVCVSVPKANFKGFYWNKDIVSLENENLSQLDARLLKAEKDLQGRYNSADYIEQFIVDIVAISLLLSSGVRASVNKYRGTTENTNDMFNITMDMANKVIIPISAIGILRIVRFIKRNAEQYKAEVKESQEMIKPKLM